MAKITGPLHANEARGKIAKAQIMRRQRGNIYAISYNYPGYKKKFKVSERQKEQREKYKEGTEAWRTLTNEEKELYNKKAEEFKITGYNLFIKEYIKKLTELNETSKLGKLILGKAKIGFN